jgi:hypothetical protein
MFRLLTSNLQAIQHYKKGVKLKQTKERLSLKTSNIQRPAKSLFNLLTTYKHQSILFDVKRNHAVETVTIK